MLTMTAEHRYYDETNREYDGVTSILKAEGFIPSSEWIDPWYLERGSMIHLATELYDKGVLDESTVDERIRGYLESYKKLNLKYNSNDIEVMLSDHIYGYAGTIDRLPLRDIKSGQPDKWHKLQLGAYYGLCKANKFPLESYIKPSSLYLQEDGSVPKIIFHSLTDISKAHQTFLCALNVHRAKKEMKII